MDPSSRQQGPCFRTQSLQGSDGEGATTTDIYPLPIRWLINLPCSWTTGVEISDQMRIDAVPRYAWDLVRSEHYEGNLVSNLLVDRHCCVATIDASFAPTIPSPSYLGGCEMTASTWWPNCCMRSHSGNTVHVSQLLPSGRPLA